MTSAVLALELLGLLLPVECAGCGTHDVAWCAACARRLSGRPWRCEDRAPRLDRLDGRGALPVWTLADCSGDVRRAIIAWKDRGRLDLTRAFAGALCTAGGALAHEVSTALAHEVSTALAHEVSTPLAHEVSGSPGVGPAPLLVVASPSTSAARRRRGGNLVDALADGLGRGLTGAGVPAQPGPALARSRGHDQVGLGARARARNLAGHVRVPDRRADRYAGRSVLVVDDVLTTGATIAACRSALEDAGARVVGAVTLASTPGPSVAPRLPPRPGPSKG